MNPILKTDLHDAPVVLGYDYDARNSVPGTDEEVKYTIQNIYHDDLTARNMWDYYRSMRLDPDANMTVVQAWKETLRVRAGYEPAV
jgi:hypothetical protein